MHMIMDKGSLAIPFSVFPGSIIILVVCINGNSRSGRKSIAVLISIIVEICRTPQAVAHGSEPVKGSQIIQCFLVIVSPVLHHFLKLTIFVIGNLAVVHSTILHNFLIGGLFRNRGGICLPVRFLLRPGLCGSCSCYFLLLTCILLRHILIRIIHNAFLQIFIPAFTVIFIFDSRYHKSDKQNQYDQHKRKDRYNNFCFFLIKFFFHLFISQILINAFCSCFSGTHCQNNSRCSCYRITTGINTFLGCLSVLF